MFGEPGRGGDTGPNAGRGGGWDSGQGRDSPNVGGEAANPSERAAAGRSPGGDGGWGAAGFMRTALQTITRPQKRSEELELSEKELMGMAFTEATPEEAATAATRMSRDTADTMQKGGRAMGLVGALLGIGGVAGALMGLSGRHHADAVEDQAVDDPFGALDRAISGMPGMTGYEPGEGGAETAQERGEAAAAEPATPAKPPIPEAPEDEHDADRYFRTTFGYTSPMPVTEDWRPAFMRSQGRP